MRRTPPPMSMPERQDRFDPVGREAGIGTSPWASSSPVVVESMERGLATEGEREAAAAAAAVAVAAATWEGEGAVVTRGCSAAPSEPVGAVATHSARAAPAAVTMSFRLTCCG